jgi:apolipoprotein N-acyltransferase
MSPVAAVLSGLLLALSFPTVVAGVRLPDLSPLAWTALVPLLIACRRRSLKKVGLLTFLTGLIFNSLVLYWLFIPMLVYGRWSLPLSLGVFLFQSGGLALWLALVVILAFWLERRGLLSLWLGLPVLWTVLFEWIRNYGPFGGHPWTTLGYSQANHLSLIQSADLFGVYGITFLIVFVNLSIAEVWEWLLRRRLFPAIPVLVSCLFLGASVGYGHWRIREIDPSLIKAPTMRIAPVQPNVPQRLKLQGLVEDSTRLLGRLTDESIAEGAELVIWPETSYVSGLALDFSRRQPLSGWTVPVLIGATTGRLKTGHLATEVLSRFLFPLRTGRTKPLYNSAVQVAPGGWIEAVYHKVHLVPMAEYVPLKNLFPSLERIAPVWGHDFDRGEKDQLLKIRGRPYGVTICYEDIFPEISRHDTRAGADFLVNMTNDAWYDTTSAPWQHLAFSVFRAVENRRTMVRSANTGVTAVIDPAGRITASLPIRKEGFLVKSVTLGGPKTIYTRYMNAPWLLALGLTVGISILFPRKHVL